MRSCCEGTSSFKHLLHQWNHFPPLHNFDREVIIKKCIRYQPYHYNERSMTRVPLQHLLFTRTTSHKSADIPDTVLKMAMVFDPIPSSFGSSAAALPPSNGLRNVLVRLNNIPVHETIRSGVLHSYSLFYGVGPINNHCTH